VDDDRQPPDAVDDDGRPPHLDESVRRVGRAGRDVLDAALDSGQALRKLVIADLAFARSALGRALAWTGVAIVFGASAWLLVIATLIALLRNVLDWSWLASIAVAAGLSLILTGIASWRVSVFFDHAGLHATRRQLAKIGIGDSGIEDDAPEPADPAAPPSERP